MNKYDDEQNPILSSILQSKVSGHCMGKEFGAYME